jgi:hypothetical protein
MGRLVAASPSPGKSILIRQHSTSARLMFLKSDSGAAPHPKSHAGAWPGPAHERVLALAWVVVKGSGPLANGDIMCPFMYRLCG